MKKLFATLLCALISSSLFSQIKILPLGESTTDSGPSYRRKLCELLTNFGSKYDMVGPKNDGATTYDGDHAGYSGNPSDQVQVKLESFYTTISPNVVLIWEGTNDCGWASANGDTTKLGKLVDKVFQFYPNAQVFIGSIPPMSYNAYESAEHGRLPGIAQANGIVFNKNLPALVAKRANAGKKAYFVDATSMTLADVSSDGIHPNQQGYDKMGTFFFEAMKKTVLDTEKPSTPSTLEATNITNNTFTLTWIGSKDNLSVAGYNIYKDRIFYGTSVNLSANITALGAGQTYKFQVEAIDASGNLSPLSAELTVVMKGAKETTPPSIPSNVGTITVAATNFMLSWTASTDNDLVLGYEIFKDGELVGFVTAPETKIAVSNLIPGVSYSMTVRAKDASGNLSLKSGALVVTTLDGILKYEAEDAVLSGGAKKATDHTGFSGTGFTAQMETVGATVAFNVGVATAGNYLVSLKYSNSMGNARTITIYVNDVKIKQTSLANLANWNSWANQPETLTLQAGANKIAYKYDNGDLGFVNLDFIEMAKSSVTGLDLLESNTIAVYPNPVIGDKLYLDFTKAIVSQLQISILNSTGNVIFTSKMQNVPNQSIELPPSLPSGVYMLQAIGEGKLYMQKFILE